MLDNSDGRFDDPEESDEDEGRNDAGAGRGSDLSDEGPLLPYAPGADPDGDLPDLALPPAESSASARNPFAELFADDDKEEEEEDDEEEEGCLAGGLGGGEGRR